MCRIWATKIPFAVLSIGSGLVVVSDGKISKNCTKKLKIPCNLNEKTSLVV